MQYSLLFLLENCIHIVFSKWNVELEACTGKAGESGDPASQNVWADNQEVGSIMMNKQIGISVISYCTIFILYC